MCDLVSISNRARRQNRCSRNGMLDALMLERTTDNKSEICRFALRRTTSLSESILRTEMW
ncbi:hypothetical protein CY34DRAFT_799730 [Suillus luteus UH-Slu-Lm8-n1]|uniref:Unplaced genomic scaffold CY34scaffold_20, whole genome shotgun sequence n=1 Tax=Suillus luteus UH-Slu-Lm8-n1 TaxID=930992 RepID=A0A0D0BMH7_9AGAM|nr:hypothetical protein CY34DRAFT_799730 [Suillus luteus UH-Slu-Lm8-n1]